MRTKSVFDAFFKKGKVDFAGQIEFDYYYNILGEVVFQKVLNIDNAVIYTPLIVNRGKDNERFVLSYTNNDLVYSFSLLKDLSFALQVTSNKNRVETFPCGNLVKAAHVIQTIFS